MESSLANTELLFIKNYVYGLPLAQIRENIGFDNDQELFYFKKNIHSKLSVKSDLQMIQKSYANSLFTIDEFFLLRQQYIAFGTAYNMYILQQKEQINVLELKELYIKVLRIHVKIINDYTIIR